MEVTLTVTNPGGTTPNFTADMTDLQAFLNDVRSRLQKNETYVYTWNAETEKWYLYGIEHEMKGITLTVVDESEDMLADGDTVTAAIELTEQTLTEPGKRTPDMYDYAADGKIVRGIPARMIFVEAEADLEDLPDGYLPGTIAATIGFGSMWQLDGDGEWQPIGTEGE